MEKSISTAVESAKEIYKIIKGLDYSSVHGIDLTREERIILHDIFYVHDQYYCNDLKFIDNSKSSTSTYFVDERTKDKIQSRPGFRYFSDEQQKQIYTKVTKDNFEEIIKRVIKQLTEEEKQVVLKCGIKLEEMFLPYYNNEYFMVRINSKIKSIIENQCEIHCGDYVIRRTQHRPLNRDDIRILRYREEYQEGNYLKAKDGLSCYHIEKKGDKNELFMYHEDIGFPDFASIAEIAIMGDYGLCGPRDTSYGIIDNYELIMSTVLEIKNNIPFDSIKNTDEPKKYNLK